MSNEKEQTAGYNIVTLMKRLEAATSRLEDLTVFQQDALKKAGNSGSSIASGTSGSKSVTIDPTPQDVTMANAPEIEDSSKQTSPSLKDYDEFVAEFVDPFVAISKSIDPLVEEQIVYLAKAFESERKLIAIAQNSQKPKDYMDPTFQELFGPVMQQGAAINSVRESNRTSKFSNHLATIAEGVPAIGWVTDNKPVSYITDFKDSAQFFGNKILKEFKDSDKKQVEWVQHFSKMLNALQTYVKTHHPAGLTWDPKGKPLAEVAAASEADTPPAAASGGPAGGAPPPPPPPPPPPLPADLLKDDDDKEKSKSSGGSGGMNAVFAELNKGSDITSGLKKVDKSEMTHKNPDLRKQPPKIPPKKKSSLSGASASKPQQQVSKRPPRKELEDTKWIVEYFENEHELVIDGEMNQSVFIDKCQKCTIQVKGKVNTIFLNNCKEVGLMAESLVASIEYVNCNNFKVQVTGSIPTLTIDQCNDGHVFLSSSEAKKVEIYTSQTTGLNICPVKDGEDGSYDEIGVPEQMVHRVGKDGNLVSEIVIGGDD